MRGVVVWAVVLVAVLSAGCSGGDPSSADPVGQPAPVEGASSSPAGTDDVPDTSTPESTIRAWVAADDRLQNTGESADYLFLSTDACEHCTNFAELVEQTFAAGGSAEVPKTKVLSIELTEVDGGSYYEAHLRTEASTMTSARGREPQRFEGGDLKLLFLMLLTPDGWRVDGVFGQRP